MRVDELLEVVRSERTGRRREVIEWVEPVPSIDAGAGRTHRSTLAHALMVTLFADVLDRVPSGRTYCHRQARAGRRIVLDHGAIRTVDWHGAGTMPTGLDEVRRILEPLGWRQAHTYDLERLSMTGTSWTHLDAPERLAQWFVSVFHTDRFANEVQEAVARTLQTATDPLSPDALAALAELAADDAIDDADALDLLPALSNCFARHHELPSLDDYELFCSASPELAWISTEGTQCNHMTDRVADLDLTAEEERVSGRPIKDSIEVSASGRVRQTAHRAAMVEHSFTPVNGVSSTPRTVPGSFFEFIQRDTLPEGGLDLAFDAANAQGIFAMTRRAHDDGDGTPVEESDHARLVARPAFTFKVRRRHLSTKRQAELDEWIGRWGVPIDGPLLDWDTIFDRPSDSGRRNGLDIGFGHGESTIVMARHDPTLDVIGVEVHDPGVVTVLDAIENEPLRNVRVMHGDLIRFLRRLETESLDVVRIFFPDPWNKVRQQHRRLVRDDVIGALTDRLRAGGELHLATDIADYAAQMRAVCEAEPRLVGGVIERPDERPLTRFEQRGLDAGRAATDLRFHRH